MRRASFTLIELLLVIGIIAVIAGIVIIAINPGKQLGAAQNAKRTSDANQLEKALSQFMIDNGRLPDDPTKYPSTKGDAVPICVLNPTNSNACVNLTELVKTYIAALPADPLEPCGSVTGYAAYADKFGPHVIQRRDTDNASCPVAITAGSISNGMATLSGDLDLGGSSLLINAGGSLNLNGHKVLNGTVTNNGTIVAQGNEQVTLGGANAGAWTIVGKSDGSTIDPTILNGKSITNLTIAPTVAGTIVKPTSALNVTGQLSVGSTAIFDATGANSTFGGAVSNNGAIILGDNAVHFNGGYDSANGQTVFVGTNLPSTLTYHDLTVNGNATVGADTVVSGALTVNTGKTLTIASGKTLTTNGNVNIQGNLTGAGALDLGNGGQNVTVGATGSLSGQDTANLLTLKALQAWFLKYAGGSLALSNLSLTNANNGSTTGTVGCTSCGGTGNQGINACGAGTIWNGSQCIAGNCMSDGNCNGYTCSLATHTCTTSCATLTDCNANGYVCNGSSCVVGNCTSDANCAGGIACVGNSCKTTCTQQSDCKTGYACNGGACGVSAVVCSIAVSRAPGIAITPDGSQVYAVNYMSDTASAINTTTNTVTLTQKVQHNPRGVAVSPDGTKAYVAGLGGLSVIDTSSNLITATVSIDYAGSRSVVLSPDGTKAFVANWSGHNVSVVNTSTNLSTATINTGGSPYTVAITPDGTKVFVADNSGKVFVINTATNTFSSIATGGSPYGIAVSPDGTKVFVTNWVGNSVFVISVATNTFTTIANVGSSPYGVTFSRDGTKAYVADSANGGAISVINTATNTVTATVNMNGAGAYDVVTSPDGSKLYIAGFNTAVSILNTATNSCP